MLITVKIVLVYQKYSFSFGVDSKEGFRISFPVYTDVFCIHLLEDFIAFGCKGKIINKQASSRNQTDKRTLINIELLRISCFHRVGHSKIDV